MNFLYKRFYPAVHEYIDAYPGDPNTRKHKKGLKEAVQIEKRRLEGMHQLKTAPAQGGVA